MNLYERSCVLCANAERIEAFCGKCLSLPGAPSFRLSATRKKAMEAPNQAVASKTPRRKRKGKGV